MSSPGTAISWPCGKGHLQRLCPNALCPNALNYWTSARTFYVWPSSFMKKNNPYFTWITVKWGFCYVQPNLNHGWYSGISKSQCAALSQVKDLSGAGREYSLGREGLAEWRALVFTVCASDWASSHILSSLYGLGFYWCSRLTCQRDSLGFLCLGGITFNEQLLCSFPY